MKLPALWIVAAFAAGVLLAAFGLLSPAWWAAVAGVSLLASLFLLRQARVAAAWGAALCAWIALGALAAAGESRAVPEHHVTRLLPSASLDTTQPLRWRGQLRSDPVQMPWGMRYEIALDEVESAAGPRPASGGLRLSYFSGGERAELLPPLRAGDRVEALARARPPRNFRNPGANDARALLAQQGVHLTGSLRSVELLRKLAPVPVSYSQRMARVRGNLLQRLNRLYASQPEHAAILRAMLLGDFSFVDRETSEIFQKTAVYHVLVISGMHVVAISVFVWWMARRMRFPLELTVALILLLLFAFVSIVEDRPPIARALWMAAVTLGAQLWYRRSAVLNSLAVAAGILLAIRPSSLFDSSFQLSFVAAGLIGGVALPLMDRTTAPFRNALSHLQDLTRDAAQTPRAAQLRLDLRGVAQWLGPRLPQGLRSHAHGMVASPAVAAIWLWEGVLISAVVQLGMVPLMAHYFHRVTPAGPVANLPAGALSGLIVPVGFLSLGGAAIFEWLGRVLAWCENLLVTALVAVVSAVSEWSFGAYRIPGPPRWLLILFYVSLGILAVLLVNHGSKRRLLLPGFALGAAIALCATHPLAPQLRAGALEVTVLDVGQGDSIFAAFPDGRTLLVDGGGTYGASRIGGARVGLDVGEQAVSNYLWQRGLRRIDAVALTHAHNDHLDGLKAVLENFAVSELWYGREVSSRAFQELRDLARARGAKLKQLHRGDHFEWGGVTGMVLWPEDVSATPVARNDDSLVLRLEHGTTTFLLTGDVEKPVEQELVTRGDPLRADFLKVAHHGSRTSSTSSLLEAAAPQVAVASFGEDNPFGYPHREVVARLCAQRVRFLRTDRDGAVSAISDGRSLAVETYAEAAGLPGREPTPCPSDAAIAAPQGESRPAKAAPPGKRIRKPRPAQRTKVAN